MRNFKITFSNFCKYFRIGFSAAAGKFKIEEATAELKKLHTYLHAILEKFEAKDQVPFQKVMGKIEVIGELIIKHHETH